MGALGAQFPRMGTLGAQSPRMGTLGAKLPRMGTLRILRIFLLHVFLLTSVVKTEQGKSFRLPLAL